MFSSTKILGTLSIIAGVLNALMGVFILTYIDDLKLTFAQSFSAGAYVITTSLILLLLGAALFGLGGDLNISTDSTAAKVADLKKRVERLENMQ